MDGFTTIVTKEKRKRIPLKMQPIYSFLQRSMTGQNVNKEDIKEQSASFIRDFFTENKMSVVRCLTMPGVSWEWERMLKLRLSHSVPSIWVSVHGCEKDYKAFCLSAAHLPCGNDGTLRPQYSDFLKAYVVKNKPERVYLMNIDIFDLLTRNNPYPDKYHIIWFDTTGTVLSIFLRLKGLENWIGEKCVLMITVLKGREHWKFDSGRIDYVSKNLLPFGFTLAKQMSYFDTSPMLHLIYVKK